MEDESARLRLALRGGPADAHRVSLTDLTTLLSALQRLVRNVGAVEAGTATGRGGRKLAWLEDRTELVLVAPPAAGSVELELELEDRLPSFDPDRDDIGVRSLRRIVDAPSSLGGGALPTGFDPASLKALVAVGTLFRKGFEGVDLVFGTGPSQRVATIDAGTVASARRLTERPLQAPASTEGILIAVDLGTDPMRCRIDRHGEPSVVCLVPQAHRALANELLDQAVHVEGSGRFSAGSDEPSAIDVLLLRATSLEPSIDRSAWREHRTWEELALEGSTPVLEPQDIPVLFEDDDELEAFLTATRGSSIA